nr:MAG TPA: hypothetical protein [Caudoviricetes sp.]
MVVFSRPFKGFSLKTRLLETLEFRGFGGTTPSPHLGLAPTRYSEIPPRYFGLRP